jgi:hypothetical protein
LFIVEKSLGYCGVFVGLTWNKRNPPSETIQSSKKNIFFTNGSPKGVDEELKCLKNGQFCQTSQLKKGGFGYI